MPDNKNAEGKQMVIQTVARKEVSTNESNRARAFD